MASTINADTGNGLVMTPDTSGEIKLQSAGTDIVSVTANGIDVTGGFTVDTNTLYVDSTNNRVGIGTTSPLSKLDIEVGSAGAPTYKGKLRVFSNTTSGDSGIELLTSSFGSGFGARLITIDEGSGQTPFVIQNRQNSVAWTERMRITSAGNVGIGTSSPSYALDVNNVSRVAGLRQAFQTGLYTVDGALSNYSSTNGVYLNGNASGWLRLNGDGTNASYIQVIGASNVGSGPNTIQMYTSSAERMRINSLGNVGIGTSSPGARLDIASKVQIDTGNSFGRIKIARADSSINQIYIQGADIAGTSNFLTLINAGGESSALEVGNGFRFYANTSTTERMRIDSAGNVGIGTSSPSEKLDVNGTVKATSFSGDGSNLTGIQAGVSTGKAIAMAIVFG